MPYNGAMGTRHDDNAMQRRHFMYVLRCADGTLYTGYTTDVEQRVATHNAGKGAKYTARRLPVELLACASFETKHEAMSAEYHFKLLTRAQKLGMLETVARDGADDLAALLKSRFGL